MKNYKYILYLFCIVFFSFCKKENWCDCVKTTGNVIGNTRDVKDFTCITTEDKMDVYLTQGSNFEVTVVAGTHLQKLIKTEIDGETLKVFNKNRCNWVRGYKHRIKIYITAPYFKYLKNTGVGSIISEGIITQDMLSLRIENSGEVRLNLNTQEFRGSVHGNGDLYLEGKTDRFLWDNVGTNYVYAQDLTINNYVYLHHASIGKVFIKAPENGLMDILIDKSGDAHYTGNPAQINLTETGKGKLIKD